LEVLGHIGEVAVVGLYGVLGQPSFNPAPGQIALQCIVEVDH
jgi:hypothetical protein